jgi:hypothetical protein
MVSVWIVIALLVLWQIVIILAVGRLVQLQQRTDHTMSLHFDLSEKLIKHFDHIRLFIESQAKINSEALQALQHHQDIIVNMAQKIELLNTPAPELMH